ncbi:TPA: hypothetical protein ACG8KV_002603, partial [Enterococcus faecium]
KAFLFKNLVVKIVIFFKCATKRNAYISSITIIIFHIIPPLLECGGLNAIGLSSKLDRPFFA